MNKVTAIGEILFDVYPEEKKLGGAPFNFIFHIINLTGEGNFVSKIGNDDLGNEIEKFLKDKKISDKYLQIDRNRKTGVAKPKLDESKVPDWQIEEERAYDYIIRNDALVNLINNQTDCLYFGTLAQRNEVSKKTIQSFFNKDIKYFCDLNIRQIFYSKEIIMSSLKTTNVLKLNSDELKLVSDLIYNEDFEEEKIVNKILNDFNIELLCITKGSSGSTIYTDENKNHYERKVENTVDTVGAGDAYASILCIGFLRNWNIEKINILASEFAAEIIKVNGALPSDQNIYEKFRNKL